MSRTGVEEKVTVKKGKASIPKHLKDEVWVRYCGKVFSRKCWVPWCKNEINVFNFHVGHNIPESKGGSLVITNLRPICGSCNTSMSDKYTIDEWNKLGGPKRRWFFGLLEVPCGEDLSREPKAADKTLRGGVSSP
jgi:5-methylcytosine-specific restriction endonuclease McrA